MSATKNEKIIEVAYYFIKKNEEPGINSSHKLDSLKLQKLLYYAKAWGLVFNDGAEIFPDKFQAWIHGPANLKTWRYFQGFDFTVEHPDIASRTFDDISDNERNVLDIVWSVYGKFDGKYLEMLTHRESPWLQARQGIDSSRASQNVITEESMRTYYEQRLKEARGLEKTNTK